MPDTTAPASDAASSHTPAELWDLGIQHLERSASCFRHAANNTRNRTVQAVAAREIEQLPASPRTSPSRADHAHHQRAGTSRTRIGNAAPGGRLMATFTDTMQLGEARDELRRLVDHGHKCPCCTQFAKVYRRKLTSVAARAVIALYQEHRLEYAHLPTVARHRLPDCAHQGGYLVLGAHWGLIEEDHTGRGDGGRAGYWRVTRLGEAWVLNRTTIPKYARLYDGRCLGLTGDPVRVTDTLGGRFDYSELMAA